jgi:hypothetical protein
MSAEEGTMSTEEVVAMETRERCQHGQRKGYCWRDDCWFNYAVFCDDCGEIHSLTFNDGSELPCSAVIRRH